MHVSRAFLNLMWCLKRSHETSSSALYKGGSLRSSAHVELAAPVASAGPLDPPCRYGGEGGRRAQAAQIRPCHPEVPLEKRRRRQVSSAFWSAFWCLPPRYMPMTSTPK
jgi:hypothetical protein